MTTQQRKWQHNDGEDGADPLTYALSTERNRSILPEPEPWWKSQLHWPTVAAVAATVIPLALIGCWLWIGGYLK
jgi:hypothetical protein